MAWICARREAARALQAACPVFPDHGRGLTCGAKTRKGTPCPRRDPYGPGARCRFHGGRSTGPKTVDVLPALQDGASTAVFPSPIEGEGTTGI